jgi:outer membrane receptor for ferrienterochelin and colicin
MLKTLTLFGALLFIIIPAFSQQNQQRFTISGYIEDAASAEKLISSAIYDRTNNSGAVSNTYGFYSLTLPKGEVGLFVSYVGYKSQDLAFILRGDTTINFRMETNVELQTVEISAKKQDRIENKTQMSQVTIPIAQIKKIPALLGEVDVLKALQLLPGVQGGSEGQNGLYVRGGSPDQNLILLDGVPVYNVSHLGGFFSVFNGDAIKNVTLTKGGFPARFGGRLSSILEIDMKEGNMKEFHGEGGIGIITSRLTLEGPIVKDKASFMISGRRSYLDVFARPLVKSAFSQENPDGGSIGFDLQFYDLNAKVNWKINEKHRLFLSAYTGSDVFGTELKTFESNKTDYNKAAFDLNWGNVITAFRWNWLLSNKLFANTTLTYSSFKFNTLVGYEQSIKNKIDAASANYMSGIQDWAGKMEFDYSPSPKHRLRFGASATYHTYVPGILQVKTDIDSFKLNLELGSNKTYSFEPYAYIEDDMQFGSLKANVGVHLGGFAVQGRFFGSVQPRLGLNYLLSNNISVKASFATMQQNVNLLTNESVGLPTDLWVPSTKRIVPQQSWQAALGIAKTIKDQYELSIEGFYKDMKNLISYKEGASFFGRQNNWEDKITQGNGKSYGLEFFVQKKEGKTTGWVGYTLSWNKRQFDELNSGIEYDFKFDRRHDFKVIVSHQFTKRFSFTGTWVYGTGNALTIPTNVFRLPNSSNGGGIDYPYADEYEVSSSGERNAYRMPSYHRMDINFEWTKKKKRHTRTWTFGAYNAYNRANPFAVLPATRFNSQTGKTERYYRQLSIFPIIPSFAYNFKF